MRSFSLLAILIFLIMGPAFSQIEDFEDEPQDATTFTLNGFNFTTTGDLIVEHLTGQDCDGLDAFLGSEIFNGGSSGSFGSIVVTDPGTKFTISTSSSWCIWLSNDDGWNASSGSVKFTGTLANDGPDIDEIFDVVHTGPGWTDFNFTPGIWGGQELTALEVSIVSGINYISLDNLAFEDILTTSVSDIQEEEIKVFPSPTHGVIEISGIYDSEVKIVDSFGRIIKEQFLVNQKIDISELPLGIYFITFNTNNQQIVKKIMKY